MRNIGLAQLQLGHKNPKTTLDNYFIPNDKDKQTIDDAMISGKKITREDILKDIVKRYINSNVFDPEDFLLVVKALKEKNNKYEKRGRYDGINRLRNRAQKSRVHRKVAGTQKECRERDLNPRPPDILAPKG